MVALGAIQQPVVGADQVQAGVPILVKDARVVGHVGRVRRRQPTVQEVQVRGVDVAFERLDPVALTQRLGRHAIGGRHGHPLEVRQGRRVGPRAHVAQMTPPRSASGTPSP